MVRKSLAAALLALALGACAELTAERPLFTVADQGLQPLLQEGVWISVGEDCPESNLRRRRFPQECVPIDIRRDEDGSWRIQGRVDLVSNLTAEEREEAEGDENGPYRMLLAPAVERDLGDSFAPLYIGELALMSARQPSISYAVIVPRGELPASEMYLSPSISCLAILFEGPIEGVTPVYIERTDVQGNTNQELDGCTATTQAAVREAARRIVIESFVELTERRWVRVRGN